jgi:hypothetical protein
VLAENKVGKYLVYAFGEIVLVMFGILLALQVNNWNESRKEILVREQLVNLLISDLEEKRKENQTDLLDAYLFIENFKPSFDTWKKDHTIDTTHLKRNVRLLGADFFQQNEKSPLYATLANTDLWKEMPDSLTKQIEDIYRILDKTSEHATFCKLHFLVPNDLIDVDLNLEDLQEKVANVGEEYISYAKLFMSNCKNLKGRLKWSETGITALIENLESYIESKK